MICVQQSQLKEYFENTRDNSVYLLGETESKSVWSKVVHPNTRSYFDLPDDCWIVSGSSYFLGDWITAFNTENYSLVKSFLNQGLNWKKKSEIRFLIKSTLVLQTTWEQFIDSWDNFIAIESDCPIVAPINPFLNECLVFRSAGDVFRIEKR